MEERNNQEFAKDDEKKMGSAYQDNTEQETNSQDATTKEDNFERIHPDDVEVVDKEDGEDISSAEMAAKLKDDFKKAVSMATKSASKSLSKLGKEAEKTVKDVAKTASEKAAKVKEETVKAAKDTAEKAGEKATKVKEETVKAAKETVDKVKEKKDCKTEVFIQYQGREAKADDLAERIKAQYRDEGHDGPVNSIKLYVKLEDGCVYYVINDESAGKINL